MSDAPAASVRLLDGTGVEVAGVRFFGLGGEIPRRSDDRWNESMTEEDARRALRAAAPYDVLVTHTPPLGHCDEQLDGRHEGSAAIGEAIDAAGPSLCLCGHIHHACGRIARVGSTTVHNLGPVAVRYTLPAGR